MTSSASDKNFFSPRKEKDFFLEKLVAEELRETKEEPESPAPTLRKTLIDKIQDSFSENRIYIDKEVVFYAIIKEFFPEFNDREILFDKLSGKYCHDSEEALIFLLLENPSSERTLLVHPKNPDRRLFPPIMPLIEDNCQPFEEGKDHLVYATLVSLYRSLQRYYNAFHFVLHSQELKSFFEENL